MRDIVDAICMIEAFTSGMDFEAFREDPKTVAAVERKLQIISEAALRLGTNAEKRCPELPGRDIQGIGDWLRHQYDRIELSTIWKTVQIDLPPLKAGVLPRKKPACPESSLAIGRMTRCKPGFLHSSVRLSAGIEW